MRGKINGEKQEKRVRAGGGKRVGGERVVKDVHGGDGCQGGPHRVSIKRALAMLE